MILPRRTVDIIRLEESEFGTFGVLKIDNYVFCLTLEPHDYENMVRVSSIPAQQYICRRYKSPTHGWTFHVEDVPGRTAVLFHKGNFVEHTAGCIILGSSMGEQGGRRCLNNSAVAFNNFMDTMAEEGTFHLTINEVF